MHHISGHIVKEVQGLRAIAVVSVLIYHLWPVILPGGYVGVDVFFVISGFLITGSLIREFESKGRINIAGFYARRIRRLLPAAMLVSASVALSIPLFPKGDWAEIVRAIMASTAYVQNWSLAAQAVDYLAGDIKGPMNHFWSLSVEEQYYIVWPLILVPVVAVARRAGLDPRRAFAWIIAIIGGASLAYSVFLTPLDPATAYFATTTRAWELALGGALSIILSRSALADSQRALLGLAGILGIVIACAAFDESVPFPGYAALLPTIGAAAVIASSGSQAPWSACSLLRSRPFQYLGDISYSLYLWHWPLILVYGEVTGRVIGPLDGAALLLASCGLAHLSKVYVEDRFRIPSFSITATVAAGAACIAATLVLGAGYLGVSAGDQDLVASADGRRGALALDDPQYNWRNENLADVVPKPEMVRSDVPYIYASNCHQGYRMTEVVPCDIGNPDSKMKVVVLGDSHAWHLYPAFAEIANKGSIYFRGLYKSACLFSLEAIYHPPFKRLYTECLEWSKNVIVWLERERPDIVLISQSPGYSETALEGMAAAWSHLVEMGLDVRAFRSTPWLRFDPGKCLMTSKNWSIDCAPSRRIAFKNDLVLTTAEKLKLTVLDLTDHLCDNDRCPTIIGGVLVYKDRHHFTAAFSRTLGPVIEKKLSLGPTN